MATLDELYDKTIVCPVCEFEFKSKKVRTSRLRMVKRDEDFLSYYEGENPLNYNIFLCPNCGFAASEGRFKKIKEEEKEVILKEITSKWKRRDYGDKRTVDEAIVVYKLALYIGQLLDYKKVELGTLSLSLGWLYRIKEMEEEELRFLTLARELYEDGFYNESLTGTGMNELKLSYLIGELYRRLGGSDKAVKWFNTTLSNPNIHGNPAMESMAREQWTRARESR